MLLGVFVIFIWIMPIYALDLDNSTSNLSVNSIGDQNQSHDHLDGNHKLYRQILPKNTSAGKFKDIQDLRLKILQILEGMRFRGQQNGSYSIRYNTEVKNESTEMEILKSNLVRC